MPSASSTAISPSGFRPESQSQRWHGRLAREFWCGGLSRAHNPRLLAGHGRRAACEPELVAFGGFNALFFAPDEFGEAAADPFHPFIGRAIGLRAPRVQVALIVAVVDQDEAGLACAV